MSAAKQSLGQQNRLLDYEEIDYMLRYLYEFNRVPFPSATSLLRLPDDKTATGADRADFKANLSLTP